MGQMSYRAAALLWVLPLMVLWIGACGDDSVDPEPDAGGDSDTDTDADGDTDGDTDGDADFDTDTGPGGDLVGAWAELLNTSIIQTGIPIVSSQWVASRNWYLVHLTSDGQGNLTAREKLCAIKLKLETSANQSIVPTQFIDHVEVLERHVSVTSSDQGTPWQSEVVYEVRGANLCDPIADPLPPNYSAEDDDTTPCDAPCTNSHCDQDQDGHPGMTNIFNGVLNCEVYVTQRWWARLDGEIVDRQTIAGAVTDNSSEQHVLASSASVCDLGDPGTTDPQCPVQQYFKMVKVADTATCDDVLALTRCAGPGADEQNCESTGPDDPAALPLDPRADRPDECN